MLAESDVEAFVMAVLAVFIFVLAVANVAPREVDAFEIVVPFVVTFVPMVASVFPSDVEAFVIFVLAVAKVAPNEVEAVKRFAAVASEPEDNVASLRLRVAYVQTSTAAKAVDVRVLVPFAHTSAASVPNVVKDLDADAHTLIGIVEANDVDAVRTVAVVFALIVVTAEVMFADILVDALVTSVCTAIEPELRDAPVRVRVTLPQMSETRVPTDVSVLVALDQTEEANVVVETTVAPTVNVLLRVTRSPPTVLPHDIVVGQTPSGPEEGTA